ncbi:SDR family NAD(P)-dependent oxidoreductase [Metabacillus litoralis]|uniref:SDR family NAD(P)-dependent oxidoreductase n=1 Tax=Metabacillus litoralis TaxID=152268 RepID=UPI00203D4778|nr:SDR family oxidoreductase [Metabacillus litoralis]MCM3409516.1 SDR family oxidoreductase [Metabacillus litoralis]
MLEKLIENKVAIITGSGSGIGKAIALSYANLKAKVVIADINEESGKETSKEIIHHGGEALFVKTDVSSVESVKALVETAVKKYKKIDILVNNAGLEYYTTIEDTTEEQWDQTMAIDLKGVFMGIKYVLPYMKKQGSGSIINIASIAGISAWPGLGVYSAAKGGVVLLTKAAAAENGKYGIRVNCICPGSIKTPLLEEQFFAPQSDREAAEAQLLKHYPINRLGEASEIADAAIYLGSDLSSFVTGHSLSVDGGLSSFVGDLI